MNKENKIKIVDHLKNSLTENKNIYFTEVSGLDAQQISKLRRMCFDKGVVLSVVKNTLLRKAMDACDKDFSEFNDLLKGNTTLMMSQVSNAPAKVIKNFLEKEKFSESYKKIILKGGHVEESIYLGHDQLDVLSALKSKEELIGDVITLLQSPIKNLISSLGSAKQNISGILTSLENNPVELKKTNEDVVNTSDLDNKDDSVDKNTSTSEE
ncbi:MAG: 50S ribosomal protein L10 [Flavobacteriales bacterium]|nr:50S ribosomal protein L10 [Flavobacteriales bacterium]